MLVVSGLFDQPVDHLPESLSHLSFTGLREGGEIRTKTYFLLFVPDCIMQFPLDNLPPSLTYLCLEDCRFNMPLDHLPDTLTDLYITGKDRGKHCLVYCCYLLTPQNRYYRKGKF